MLKIILKYIISFDYLAKTIYAKKLTTNNIVSFLSCTTGRDRTGTSITSPVFETGASTNSATMATIKLQKYKNYCTKLYFMFVIINFST